VTRAAFHAVCRGCLMPEFQMASRHNKPTRDAL
jgi:hypothetical protein